MVYVCVWQHLIFLSRSAISIDPYTQIPIAQTESTFHEGLCYNEISVIFYNNDHSEEGTNEKKFVWFGVGMWECASL